MINVHPILIRKKGEKWGKVKNLINVISDVIYRKEREK